MEFYTLTNLKRDISQDNLYNFFDQQYKSGISVPVFQYYVSAEQEMRMDLVTNGIYNNTDYIDFLLDFNGIDNPLNIMGGDIINYIPIEMIQLFQINESNAKILRNTYLNASKVSKQDPNRASYINNNYALPPTFLEIPAESVQIVGDKIVLGGNS